MRRSGFLGLAVVLAGCGAETAPPAAEDHAAALSACRAAVAKHVGKPADAVEVSWAGVTPERQGLARAEDADAASPNGVRTHLCEFDDSGRLAAIRHFHS